MANRNTTALAGATATGAGAWIPLSSSAWQASAWLGAGGGTATVNVEVRESSSAPPYLAGTLTLSGANARDQFRVDGEVWSEIRFNVTAASGAPINGIVAQEV